MSKIGDIYRKIWGKAFRRPTNFSWVIEGRLAGSGRPTSKEEVEWLKNIGVKVIVSLTEYPVPKEWIEQSDLKYIHIPIEDHTAPEIGQIARAVEFIHKEIKDERPVVVHCAAGIGRTGTVLASYLVKYEDMKPGQAISLLRKLRPGSVENPVQEEAVKTYFKALSKRDDL